MPNYRSFWPDSSWYDAAADGYNLGLLGDDTSASLTLPFNFSFYDGVFDTVYISSNGWLSFTNPNPTQFITPQFPSTSSSYYYAVAPFWDDLEANNDIFIWENESVVVIEYNNYYHRFGGLAGTFQVVFLNTSEIIFQYLSISTDFGATIGLNYGLNPEYYNAHTSRLGGVTNFSLFFTPHAYEWHDIVVSLEAPSTAIVNVPKSIEVTVSNVGTCKEENIELALYFNGSSNLLKNWSIPLLDEGDDIAISYSWIPTVNGTYNITARTSPRPDEDRPLNNEANSTVTVYNIQEAGFIEVRVYDDVSGAPVENAEVQVFLDETLIQSGFTSSSGFYNATGLDIEFYEVGIMAPAFTSQLGGTQINWIGDDDYIFFYLDPVVLSPELVGLADITCELGSNNSLDWVAIDNNPDLYRLFKEGYTNGTGRWVAGVPITVNLAGLVLGTYNYTLVVTDGEGNFASDTVIVTVVNDTFAPQINSTGNLSYVVNTTGNHIQWTILDANPATFNVTRDGALIESDPWTSGIPLVFPVDGLPVGTYSYVITATDIYNNSASDMIIVTVIGPDTTPPVINRPADIFYPVGSVGNSIRWTANDSHPSTYTIFCNSAEVISGFWASETPLFLSVDGLGVGVYTYNITFEDQDGNFASDTVIVTVTDPDTVAPVVSHPKDITYVANFTGYSISWNATDVHPNSYVITRNGTIVDSGIWNIDTPIIINVDGLGIGTHVYTITVTDIYGNFASDVVIVTVKGSVDEKTTSSSSDSPFANILLVLFSLLGIALFRSKSLAKKGRNNSLIRDEQEIKR